MKDISQQDYRQHSWRTTVPTRAKQSTRQLLCRHGPLHCRPADEGTQLLGSLRPQECHMGGGAAAQPCRPDTAGHPSENPSHRQANTVQVSVTFRAQKRPLFITRPTFQVCNDLYAWDLKKKKPHTCDIKIVSKMVLMQLRPFLFYI